MGLINTAERVSNLSPSDNYVFQRSLLAYKEAAKIVHGKVLEIGTGSGYGLEEIAPKAMEFWTLDKHYIDIDYKKYTNTRFIKNEVPPLLNIPNHYFDYVICFQVIEHIEDAGKLLEEIKRVLKAEGKLIISTPNSKMTLSRNPWHVREYTSGEFRYLLSNSFANVEAYGVFGDSVIAQYYAKNKESVQKILKFDVLNLNKKLPRWVLKLPYDLVNRLNRLFLLKNNKELTTNISVDNYYVNIVNDECFDLFYSADNLLSSKKLYDFKKRI